MNYEKAFKYVFEDPDWVGKVIIFIVMSVLQFLIIPIFIFNGYFVKAMKMVSSGEEGLPKWDDWGELIGIGFKLFLIQLILAVPALVLIAVFGSVAIASALSQNFLMTGSSQPPEALGAGMLFGFFLLGIYGLAVAVVFPAMLMRFAAENYSIGAAFKFGEVFKLLSDNASAYIASVAVFVGLMIAAAIVGSATFGIGTLVLVPYVYLVAAHLFGQIMRGNASNVQESGAPVSP